MVLSAMPSSSSLSRNLPMSHVVLDHAGLVFVDMLADDLVGDARASLR